MKVCLVVCLALAHLATGSILQKYRTQQPRNAEPFEYEPTKDNQLPQKHIEIHKQFPSSNENLGLDSESAEASSHEVTEKKNTSVNIQKYVPLYARWNVMRRGRQYQDQDYQYNDQANQYNDQASQYNDQANQYNDQANQYTNQANQYNDQANQYNDQANQYNDQNKQYNDQANQYNDQNKPYNDQANQYTDQANQYSNDQANQYNDQAYQYNDQNKQYNDQNKQYNDQNKQYSGQYKRHSGQNKQYQTRNKAPKSQNKRYQYRSQKEDQNQSKQMMYNTPLFSDVVEWRGIQMARGPNAPINYKTDIEKIFKDSFNTVKDFTEEEKEAYYKAYMTAAENEDALLNTTQLLQKNHYAVEEHTVKTDDGYFLTLFRIPPKSSADMQTKRPVVLLMHGLLGSSDDWLLMGPGKSLAYLLADLGYDVWMGNARGNKYSRRHVSKHPGQPDFWQFSNDEIALHDLPTMIDYALSTSNQEKMYYVGYSEGTTTFFALASTKPEYNDKIIMMYALSPMVYMSNTRSPMIKMIAPNSPFYEHLHVALGHGEFKPEDELIRTIGGEMLARKSGSKHVASNVVFVMAGMVNNSDAQMVPMIVSHLPAGASTRQIKQYGQAVASREFRRYDYGPRINQKVYDSEVPPKYELSEVHVPVTLYYSAEDWLAHPTDVEQLSTKLPQVKEAYKLPKTNFSHLDFMFSKNAPETVYQRLITSIQNDQSQKQAL